MLQQINALYDQYCPSNHVVSSYSPQVQSAPSCRPLPRDQLKKAQSAAAFIDPDVDEPTWKFSIVAPLARAAQDYPQHADEYKELARGISRGDYRGSPSVAWSNPGHSNGKTGEEVFEATWHRFHKAPARESDATLGSYFYQARQGGWKDAEERFIAQDPIPAMPSTASAIAPTTTDISQPLEFEGQPRHPGSRAVFDTARIATPDPECFREWSHQSGVDLELRDDGQGIESIHSQDLTLDTHLETPDQGPKTVRELVRGGVMDKVRCQAPFRDSDSYAAFYGQGKAGQPFVHDMGTGITHWLRAADTQELELLQALAKTDQVLGRIVVDVGAALEPEAIGALTLLRSRRPADFERYLDGLKRANPRVSKQRIESATRVTHGSTAQTHHGYGTHLMATKTIGGHPPVAVGDLLYTVNPDSQLWEPITVKALAREVALAFDGQVGCRKKYDYDAIARHAMDLVENPEFFATAPIGLACPGGFYRIEGEEYLVTPLQAAHRQRVKLGITPEDRPIPMFLELLGSIFRADNPEETAQQIQRIQELMGGIMLGFVHKYQKAILFYDPIGRAGKGTLMEIIKALVPATFFTAISPYDWDREYYVAQMQGSRLNVAGELDQERAIPAAVFKMITGGDTLMGRHPTGRPQKVHNEAAHVFMSNHFIMTKDQSEAFFARWEIIEFPNSLRRTQVTPDPHLAQRILEAELSGIAYWALPGAIRLLRQQAFSPSQAHDRLMEEWRRRSNSLFEFIHDSCEIGPGFSARRSAFYAAYRKWCQETRRTPFSKARVLELLRNNLKLGITHRETMGHETFYGIRVKEFDPVGMDY